MSINIKFNNETRINVKVNSATDLTPKEITVKNQLREYQLNSIEDLPDVATVDVSNGSVMVYNSATDTYEVKKLDTSNLTGSIDGGTF